MAGFRHALSEARPRAVHSVSRGVCLVAFLGGASAAHARATEASGASGTALAEGRLSGGARVMERDAGQGGSAAVSAPSDGMTGSGATGGGVSPPVAGHIVFVPSVDQGQLPLTLVRSLEAGLAKALAALPGFGVVSQADLDAATVGAGQAAQLGGPSDRVYASAQRYLRADQSVVATLGRLDGQYVVLLNRVELVPEGRAGGVSRRLSLEPSPEWSAIEAQLPGAVRVLFDVASGVEPSAQHDVSALSSVMSAGPVRLALLPLRTDGIDPSLGPVLDEVLAAQLQGLPQVAQVLSRRDLEDVLDKHELGRLLGCTEQFDCIQDIGNSLGLSLLVAGSVGRIEASHVVILRLLDARAEVKVLEREIESYAGDERELRYAVAAAARRLLRVSGAAAPGGLSLRFNAREGRGQLRSSDKELPFTVTRHVAEWRGLGAGPYELSFSPKGSEFLPVLSQVVYVPPGTANVRTFELERAPRPWYALWPVWAFVATAVVGGYAYYQLNDSAPPAGPVPLSGTSANGLAVGARP